MGIVEDRVVVGELCEGRREGGGRVIVVTKGCMPDEWIRK